MVAKSNILYCLVRRSAIGVACPLTSLPHKVANGARILVSKRLRDGNFVQYAKKILASGLDQDGDHCRSYVASSLFLGSLRLKRPFAAGIWTTRGSLPSTCW